MPDAIRARRVARLAAAVMVATVTAAAAAVSAQAQGWPQRTITFIVSQAGGSSPDVMARLVADRLSKTLAQGVVIENKPGGGNVIGAVAAAHAAPDGYTFFFATSAAMSTNPFLMKNLPYRPVEDFVPVSLVTRSHQLLVVHPDLPVTSVAELIALDKATPGRLSIGVDSPRNLAGVTAQALNRRGGTSLVLVPYPNINSGLQDTVAGRVQVGIYSESIVGGLIADKKMRALAVASAKRSVLFPELPTIAETLPGFDYSGWFMIVAPTGTPADIVGRLNREVDAAIGDAHVGEMAPKLGFELVGGSSEDAARFLRAQLALWDQITRELGLQPQ